MLYQVKLPDGEIRLLTSLVGRNLNRITTDGWSVQLECDALVLDVHPEEAATPDSAHPYGDVDRPRIALIAAAGTEEHRRPIAEHFGEIVSVHLLSTLLSFSALEPRPAVSLPGGAVIPEGEGYGWIYYRSSEREVAIRELARSQAVVDLDVAVEICTESNSPVVLYTRGYFVHVSVGSLPTEDWVRFGAYAKKAIVE